MAEQVLNQFRSDKELREDCVAIYESLGMDLNTAFRMFTDGKGTSVSGCIA